MIGPTPICMTCKHLISPPAGQWGYRCAAFPEGIPDEIFVSGEIDHTKPTAGDHGIQYQPKETV